MSEQDNCLLAQNRRLAERVAELERYINELFKCLDYVDSDLVVINATGFLTQAKQMSSRAQKRIWDTLAAAPTGASAEEG